MQEHASDPETLVAAERVAAVREAFKVIAAEIGKLRGLDLGDHPRRRIPPIAEKGCLLMRIEEAMHRPIEEVAGAIRTGNFPRRAYGRLSRPDRG